MAETLTSSLTEGFADREGIDLKTIRSRIEEISKEIKDGFQPIDLSTMDRGKLLEDCLSEYREIMKRLKSQESDVPVLAEEGLGSYFDSLTKEIKSVEEENTKIDLEIDRLMDTFATDARKMEMDLEECDYLLKYAGNGGQSGKLNSSRVSTFQHQEFEILELDRQIEESQSRLEIMQNLDNALTRVDTLAEASSFLSDVKVLEAKDNSIRLFIAGPTFTSDMLLMGQKLDFIIEKPINTDHELLIEFAEGNMELKKMEYPETLINAFWKLYPLKSTGYVVLYWYLFQSRILIEIFPDDVSLNETFDMLKSSCRDFHLVDTPFLGCVVRLIQHQILLCTARRLMLKDANKSRHSFEYSERDKMVTVHLVGGIDAFIEVPLNWPLTSSALVLLSIKNSSSHSQNLTLTLVGRVKAQANSLEHPRHHLVRFANAIEEILVPEMQI